MRFEDPSATLIGAVPITIPGVRVHCYDARHVEAQAGDRLGGRADAVLRGPRATLGPPWTKDHRVALAATVMAGAAPD